jgi:hypothetical protein
MMPLPSFEKSMITKFSGFALILILLIVLISNSSFQTISWHKDITAESYQDLNSDAIRPYTQNQWYWEYKKQPLVLRGGTDDDNLWQWTGKKLIDHLDLLQSLGGNFARNTMSDRNEGNVFAHEKNKQGKYDLAVWNDEYWNRLDNFLNETHRREIIVQVTLWDWFDLGSGRFPIHPLNPDNNINWESGVVNHRDDYYGGSLRTGNQKVLDYQHNYVDKLLSITFKYDHILYNIGNESSLGAEWENHWAKYLRKQATEARKEIYITSMQFLPSHSVRHVLTYRDLYSFVEISQNNQDSRGGRGKAHYDNVIHYRRMIEADSRGPLPMNNEKIYGAGDGRNYSSGTGREAEDRFWKNIFAGCAAVRFHRPEEMWGIGLSDRAQANIKSMSVFLGAFDIFNAVPYEGISMYAKDHEGYAMANMGKQYAIYLPGGRYSVELDPWIYAKRVKVKYLDIDSSEWSDEEIIEMEWELAGLTREYGFKRGISITSPANRPCVAIIEVME